VDRELMRWLDIVFDEASGKIESPPQKFGGKNPRASDHGFCIGRETKDSKVPKRGSSPYHMGRDTRPDR